MSDEEREIKNVMIFGAGFALFGLVCPFFWLSLFNAHSGSETGFTRSIPVFLSPLACFPGKRVV